MSAPRTLRTLDEIRSSLGPTRQIIVTGPQRSGTTFSAKALAATLGRDFVDESAIRVSRVDVLTRLLAEQRPWVLQAPGLTFMLHHLPPVDGLAVIWVLRPSGEIEASERRVGWAQRGEPAHEFVKYRHVPRCPIRSISRFKLWHWRSWQAAACRADCYELPYHSEYLRGHSMFIEKPGRDGWGIKQTEPES